MRVIRPPARVFVAAGTKVLCLNPGCKCLFEMQSADFFTDKWDGTNLVRRPLTAGDVFMIRCPECKTHAAWGVYGTVAPRPGA